MVSTTCSSSTCGTVAVALPVSASPPSKDCLGTSSSPSCMFHAPVPSRKTSGPRVAKESSVSNGSVLVKV